MSKGNRIIDKIRKLQALKDRAATEWEAVNAAARIADLLAKHNLDMGAINMQKDEGASMVGGPKSGRLPLHYSLLGAAVELLFDVDWYVQRGRSGGQYTFVGATSNVEAGVATFGYLIESVENLLKGYRRANRDLVGAFDNRAFRLGASKRIKEMAGAQKAKIVAHNPGSMELVFIGQALAARMLQKAGVRHERRGMGSLDAGAFDAGYREGGRVDIHGARSSRMLQ